MLTFAVSGLQENNISSKKLIKNKANKDDSIQRIHIDERWP